MKDLWQIESDENKSIYLHFTGEVNMDLRKEIQSFLRWIRKKYVFPKKLNVYITDEAYVLTFIDEELVTASIFFPDNEKENPLIRVSTGDYSSTLNERGRFIAVCSILASIAHEITHYYQWLRDANVPFDEKQARSKAIRVVYKYLDDTQKSLL